MEPITHKEKIEAALNNEAVTRCVAMRLNHPYQGPNIFSDDHMSEGEIAIFRQRSKENAPKIAELARRASFDSQLYNG
jgi:hypothetical protein